MICPSLECICDALLQQATTCALCQAPCFGFDKFKEGWETNWNASLNQTWLKLPAVKNAVGEEEPLAQYGNHNTTFAKHNSYTGW